MLKYFSYNKNGNLNLSNYVFRLPGAPKEPFTFNQFLTSRYFTGSSKRQKTAAILKRAFSLNFFEIHRKLLTHGM